jgi:Zn-dependent peptidase ImmA (M78 family)
MAVLVARGRFATVTYNGHTTEEKSNREYWLTAEILMPEAEFRRADLSDLDAIRAASDVFKVTPSAVVMRGQRLKLLTRDDAEAHLNDLKDAFDKIEKTPRNRMLPMNALRKYNGYECSRRMLALYDAGTIKTSDFCRVMFSNAYRNDRAISDYRAAL